MTQVEGRGEQLMEIAALMIDQASHDLLVVQQRTGLIELEPSAGESFGVARGRRVNGVGETTEMLTSDRCQTE